jgi:hypothetical protein
LLKVGTIGSNLIVIDAIELDGLQFTLEQNINKVNLTQLLSNVEKQDENNISTSAKTQDNNQQRIKIKFADWIGKKSNN